MPTSRYVDFRAVKQAVTIVQILDHYKLMERFHGKDDSLSGPCPIHNGENPTQFRVSVSKNCWNCFGECKRGGNILDFVSLMENVSIRDAAIRVSDWFNLTFDKPSGANASNAPASKKDAKPKGGKSTPSQAASKPPAEQQETGPNKPLGFQLRNLDTAHQYFAERGLYEETVAEFGLGYCDNGSMKGRVVIPIQNVDGEIVAYAGRWPGDPPDAETPKYKLPAGFRKSMELFNLHRALQADPSTPLVIVEGFFDCIHLWQSGVERVVALMGSQMSPDQQGLIVQHVHPNDRIILMLDEDEAGRKGRADALQRLALIAFVKLFCFVKESDQPTDLSGDDIRSLLGGEE
jgi:DNA primase